MLRVPTPLALTLLGGLCAALLIPAAASADTLIHAGRLIDGKAATAAKDKTIVVRDGRIVEVADGFKQPGDGDTVIDLKSKTVLPGLIDLHVHLTGEGSPDSYVEGFRLNPADFAIRSVIYAERTLLAGFTTVRNLGDDSNISISLRNNINAGWIKGPRIYTAGKALATTGGHGDPTNGVSWELQGHPGPKEGVVNGAAEAMQAVRQRYKDGADMIKVTGTGGVLSYAKNGQNPQLTDGEFRAIVETAKDYDFPVAVHAHGAEGIKRAVKAGADSIEHGTFLDDEGIALMKQHGTWLVPTLLAGKFVGEKAKIEGYFPEIVRVKAEATGPQMKAMFTKALKAGVKIGFGTDTGVSRHGDNAQEFALMVEAGMAPMKAIQAATTSAAKVLRADDLGAIEAGKKADVVAVDGDPLADIRVLEKMAFVMKDGVVYKQ